MLALCVCFCMFFLRPQLILIDLELFFQLKLLEFSRPAFASIKGWYQGSTLNIGLQDDLVRFQQNKLPLLAAQQKNQSVTRFGNLIDDILMMTY